ncbi:MAG TPA: hypothetical protein DEA80_07855 [Afipia sp.]|nr:hypothetical protein [Afipia sp.]OUX62992.1 MAG: hypothetical protein CBB64_01565 [Afipia sp. TMED4]HBF54006.1 hypothetical protein [Afipia sp.]HBR44826.1 hypothetical protein [Afipia sp.]HCX18312.1 hypothetical protein [Afipia sp.]
MNPHDLFALLAERHNLAKGFTQALLETAHAAQPSADDLYGRVPIDAKDFGSIDVWLDCAGADTWWNVRTAVIGDRVVFRNVTTDGVLTKLVGAIEGRDQLEFFVSGDNKLWLVIAAAEPTDVESE